MGYAVELAQYALFHLGCSLIGEGHGKDMAVVVRLLNEQAYEVDGKGKGLSRTRRRFVDVKVVAIHRVRTGYDLVKVVIILQMEVKVSAFL